MSGPAAVDLAVEVGAVRLANPVIAASGTFGYGIEFAGLVNLNRLGGLVVKGLSLEPIAIRKRNEGKGGKAPPRRRNGPVGRRDPLGGPWAYA